jgi:WD40 repeat protein
MKEPLCDMLGKAILAALTCTLIFAITCRSISAQGPTRPPEAKHTDVTSGEARLVVSCPNAVVCLDFSPDGKRLAASFEVSLEPAQNRRQPVGLKVFDVVTGKETLSVDRSVEHINNATYHLALCRGVAFSPDGRLLALASHQAITMLDQSTGVVKLAFVAESINIMSMAMSPDGKYLASGGFHGVVSIWNAETGKLVLSWKAHDQLITRLVFSPDGRKLVSAGADRTVRVWNFLAGIPFATPTTTPDEDVRPENYYIVCGLAFSPDGKYLASCYESPRVVKIWELRTGKQAHAVLGFPGDVTAVAHHPGGRYVAAAWASDHGRGGICVCDVSTGQEVLRLPGHVDRFDTIAFNRAGTRLAAGGIDGTVRIWDLPNLAKSGK